MLPLKPDELTNTSRVEFAGIVTGPGMLNLSFKTGPNVWLRVKTPLTTSLTVTRFDVTALFRRLIMKLRPVRARKSGYDGKMPAEMTCVDPLSSAITNGAVEESPPPAHLSKAGPSMPVIDVEPQNSCQLRTPVAGSMIKMKQSPLSTE